MPNSMNFIPSGRRVHPDSAGDHSDDRRHFHHGAGRRCAMNRATGRGSLRSVGCLAGFGRRSWLQRSCAMANPGAAFQQMIIVDGFATFFRALVIIVAMLAILCSGQYLRRERSEGGEYYALILFSVAGQGIMATSNELIMMFIGLEISSIATYILAGYLRDDKRNNESALKYFLLGSFATAFLLYGVAWIYGITGSTNLVEIRRVLTRRPT